MKATISHQAVALALLVGAGTSSPAGVQYEFNSGFQDGGLIPDANTTGWSDSRTISGFASGSTIATVTVTLNLAPAGTGSGLIGDLYGYLSYTPASAGGSASGMAVLLNRIGRTANNPLGYTGSSLAVTLSDSGPGGDIHSYAAGLQSFDSYQPDGRKVDPTLCYDTSPRIANPLGTAFNTADANGTWTLFFADVSGGNQSKINSWSLDLTVVPEPVNEALAVVGGVAVMVQAGRFLRRKKKAARK